MIKPNIAQVGAIESVRNKKFGKYLIVLPSGVGKTYLGAMLTKNLKGKLLYIAHRKEILIQARDSFIEVQGCNKEDTGFVFSRNSDYDKKFVFASIQTLYWKKNLERIKKTPYDYVIVDEWHHSASKSYQKVINNLNTKVLIGLTATPYRFDGADILTQVDSIVPYKMTMEEAIKEKLLVPFEYHGLWDNVDYSGIKWNGHSYSIKDLNKKLLVNKRDDLVFSKYEKHLKGRQCIGFCVSVEHAKRMNRVFNARGIISECITKHTQPQNRKQIIEDFKEKKIQILFTVDIFNEGIDIPEVSGLLFLRPTCSKTIFVQQLGRGLRKAPNKKEVVVLDFVGNYMKSHYIGKWLMDLVGKSGRPQKPTYNMKVANIYFEEKVIDLMKFQRDYHPSKQDLIDDYYRIKKLLKRVPLANDIRKYGIYDVKTYCSRWGSWHEFHLERGDNITKYTDEQIINRFKKFIDKNGVYPKLEDLGKNNLFSEPLIRKHFGTFNKFIKVLGGKPNPMGFQKGYKHTEENKRNLSIKGKLRRHTEETKKKMSLIKTGKKMKPLTKKHKAKLSKLFSGKGNPNWKGGKERKINQRSKE